MPHDERSIVVAHRSISHVHVVQWIKSGIRSAATSILQSRRNDRTAWLYSIAFHFYSDYFWSVPNAYVLVFFRFSVLNSQSQTFKMGILSHLISLKYRLYSKSFNHLFITKPVNFYLKNRIKKYQKNYRHFLYYIPIYAFAIYCPLVS